MTTTAAAPERAEIPQAAGIDLRPFRAVTFDPGRAGDLAQALTPALDSMTAHQISRHRRQGAFSVLKLAVPEAGPAGTPDYAGAAADLRHWLLRGALREHTVPALYVYEQSGDFGVQRGVIGALHLRSAAGGVLPHEEAGAVVAADRASWMQLLGAQIDPILLSHDGDGEASVLIDRATTVLPPVLDATTLDGIQHRLTPVHDPAAVLALQRAFAQGSALIADGHHRFLAYHRLRANRVPGAECGLALLVDRARYPLTVRAIHRMVAAVPPAVAVRALPAHARVRSVRTTDEGQRLLAAAPPDSLALLLADQHEAFLVTAPGGAEPGAVPPTAAELDLVAGLLGSPPQGALGLFHDPAEALAEATRNRGCAVLMRPVTADTVQRHASQGGLMPRKTTSFSPKPALGLVLRLLRGT